MPVVGGEGRGGKMKRKVNTRRLSYNLWKLFSNQEKNIQRKEGGVGDLKKKNMKIENLENLKKKKKGNC